MERQHFMKTSTMQLLITVLAVPFGCAGSSSSNPPERSQAPLRQAVCDRYGGVWHADGTCEIQSPGPGD